MATQDGVTGSRDRKFQPKCGERGVREMGSPRSRRGREGRAEVDKATSHAFFFFLFALKLIGASG